MIQRMTREDALALHDLAIERFGGARGVRDLGALEAALAQPWQGYAGIELYPTAQEKAARACYEIVTQHPFVDGNKRTGALLLGVLLRSAGFAFRPEPSKYLEIIMDVASGAKGYEELRQFALDETR